MSDTHNQQTEKQSLKTPKPHGDVYASLAMPADELEAYCEGHSTAPSDLCQELADYTLRKVDKSIMLSGAIVGSFLGSMVRATGARRILEIGCYTGYSALAMAEHLPESGELITLDINPETMKIAQSFWDRSPHGKKIRSYIGPALETLQTLKGPFDLVFIDADKTGYRKYLDEALELLSPHGSILVDNCLYFGQVLTPDEAEPNGRAIYEFNNYVNSRSDLASMIVPLRDGIHWITRARSNA